MRLTTSVLTAAAFMTWACTATQPSTSALAEPAASDAPAAAEPAAEGGPTFVCSTEFPPGLAERLEKLDQTNTSTTDPQFHPEFAAIKDYVWGANAVLRVRFLEGDLAVKRKVEAVAMKWMTETAGNFRFVFDQSATAQIRISFDPGTGSWSYIGTSSRQIAANAATMNYGWLTATTPDEEYNRVVLHEFGHALGAIHEHQNPTVSIKWNEPAVMAYYKSTNGWNEEVTRRNIFTKYSPAAVKNSQFDPLSIMLYAFPASFTQPDSNPRETRSNTSLSQVDREMIERLYPRG